MNSIKDSIRLSRIIGPLLIAMAISEYKNFGIWNNPLPMLTYLNGTLLFLAGLSIVQYHNIWKGWQILLTVIAWLVLLAGLYRMFFPEAEQMQEEATTIVTFSIMIIMGIFLSYKGYYSNLKNTKPN